MEEIIFHAHAAHISLVTMVIFTQTHQQQKYNCVHQYKCGYI
jgi:hypothetical protein